MQRENIKSSLEQTIFSALVVSGFVFFPHIVKPLTVFPFQNLNQQLLSSFISQFGRSLQF